MNDHVGDAYATWPKILLTDANCRLGGQPDERVGTWQSEGMREKSQPFIDFLLQLTTFSCQVLLSIASPVREALGGTMMMHGNTTIISASLWRFHLILVAPGFRRTLISHCSRKIRGHYSLNFTGSKTSHCRVGIRDTPNWRLRLSKHMLFCA